METCVGACDTSHSIHTHLQPSCLVDKTWWKCSSHNDTQPHCTPILFILGICRTCITFISEYFKCVFVSFKISATFPSLWTYLLKMCCLKQFRNQPFLIQINKAVKWLTRNISNQYFPTRRKSFSAGEEMCKPFKIALFSSVCLSYRQGHTWYSYTPSLEWVSISSQKEKKKSSEHKRHLIIMSKYVKCWSENELEIGSLLSEIWKRHIYRRKEFISVLHSGPLYFWTNKQFSPSSPLPQ